MRIRKRATDIAPINEDAPTQERELMPTDYENPEPAEAAETVEPAEAVEVGSTEVTYEEDAYEPTPTAAYEPPYEPTEAPEASPEPEPEPEPPPAAERTLSEDAAWEVADTLASILGIPVTARKRGKQHDLILTMEDAERYMRSVKR